MLCTELPIVRSKIDVKHAFHQILLDPKRAAAFARAIEDDVAVASYCSSGGGIAQVSEIE